MKIDYLCVVKFLIDRNMGKLCVYDGYVFLVRSAYFQTDCLAGR